MEEKMPPRLDPDFQHTAISLSPERMQSGTAGLEWITEISRKRPRGNWYKFISWLVTIILPGFHVTENPPKGKKRVRKVVEPETEREGKS